MKKNKNNEELQSRREFFKKAAKGALPILGAIVLANVPDVMKASGSCTCSSCVGGCGTACFQACANGCTTSSCKGGCRGNGRY